MGAAWAQTTTATILGTVRDSSNAVIPGATVTLRNIQTEFTVTEVTSSSGTYRVPNLPLGTYEVRAELPGFKTSTRTGIELTVGREAVVNFTLELGELTEEVVVTGDAPLVNTTNSTVQSLVGEEVIRDLPLNSRDFMQLALLQVGIQEVIGAHHGDPGMSTQRGLGVSMSISGARPQQNGFTLDGMDVNDYANATPGSSTGNNLGVEAIQEFAVLTSTFSAEYGRSSGGVINAVTKSGSNTLNGSLFYFHRNDGLDASNFFDRGADPPDFARHQAGFSLGGPIVRNKFFFFGNYERLDENLGITQTDRTLPQATREGRLSTGNVAVDPLVAPFLTLYPLPNGRIFEGGDVGEFVWTSQRVTDEDYYTVRGDYYLSDAHRLFARYTRNTAKIVAPVTFQLNDNTSRSRRQFATVQHTYVISPALISVSGFGFNQTLGTTGNRTARDSRLLDPRFSARPGRPAGQIGVSGIDTFPGGPGAGEVEFFDQDLFQVKQDFTWTRGSHLLKFGGNIEYFQTDQDSTRWPNGDFSFQSISDFLQNIPFQLSNQLPGSDTARDWRQKMLGFYVQDDWKVSGNLSINLGVRYEFVTDPDEAQGRMANLRDLSDTEVTIGKIWDNPSYKNFAPRVGFAWDPTGSGRTAIRGGFGVFHDQMLFHYLIGPGSRMPPFFRQGQARNLEQGDFPTRAFRRFDEGRATERVTLETYQFDIDQPTQLQANFNVQRELLRNWVVQVGYVGSWGFNHARMGSNVNIPEPQVVNGKLFFVPDSPRRNPVWGNIRHRFMDGRTEYNSLQVVSKTLVGEGNEFQIAYDWSQTISDGSMINFSNDLSNSASNPYPFDPEFSGSRGLADFHVAHKVRISFTADPFARFHDASPLLRGWRLGGILSAATGSPFTVSLGFDNAGLGGTHGQRPELRAGCSDNPVLGSPEGWFDASCFELPPAGFLADTLGRNTLIGPARVTLDMNLTKNIPLGGRAGLELRFEVFNLLNRANFALPGNLGIFSTTGRLPNRGVITRTATSARQIQLGTKLVW